MSTGFPDTILGAVHTSLLRPYFGFRYYIDTTDLGTAITYANPYFVGRLEYWYQTNRFESEDIDDKAGGGIGTGVGFGMEFPMQIKKSYFNIEFKFHTVNFFDKYTMEYRKIENPEPNKTSAYGYDDLTGNVYSIFTSYNVNW